MNDEKHIRTEIAAGEAWLCATAVEPPPPDVERILLRVAVAIDERWFAEQVRDESSVEVAERIGRRLTRVVASERWRARWQGGVGRLVGCGFGLATAAMLAWVVLLPWLRSGGGDREKYLNAFDSYVDAESKVEIELAKIEDALFDLEMDSDVGSVDGWEDSVLSGLSEDIDRMWGDGES
jgi:hypothetical protein